MIVIYTQKNPIGCESEDFLALQPEAEVELLKDAVTPQWHQPNGNILGSSRWGKFLPLGAGRKTYMAAKHVHGNDQEPGENFVVNFALCL